MEFPTEEQLRETMNLKVQPEKLVAITGIGFRRAGWNETVGTWHWVFLCSRIDTNTWMIERFHWMTCFLLQLGPEFVVCFWSLHAGSQMNLESVGRKLLKTRDSEVKLQWLGQSWPCQTNPWMKLGVWHVVWFVIFVCTPLCRRWDYYLHWFTIRFTRDWDSPSNWILSACQFQEEVLYQ